MAEAEFSPEFLDAQRAKLLEERTRLQNELRAIDADLIRLGQSQADDGASVGNHMADEGGSIQEADNDMAVRGNVEQVLAEIENALKKLNNGTYGYCEDTGEPIAQARLEALPYARYTVKAQEKREALGLYRPIPSVR
jgi:DnaK suppressor protein